MDLSKCEVKEEIVSNYAFFPLNKIQTNRMVVFSNIKSCKDILKIVLI